MSKNKYFDQWEFSKAISYIEESPLKANQLLKEYLEKYRHDYSGYCYYAGTFITLGKFDEAQKILDFVEKQAVLDKKFQNFENNYHEYKKNFLYSKLRLLSYKEEYLELYRMCIKNRSIIREMNLAEVIFWSRYQTGNLIKSSDDLKRYFYRQMVSYNKQEAIDHINRHCADYNSDLDSIDRNTNIFVPEFPLNEIVEEIDKYLLSDKIIYAGFIENVYMFKYDECGRQDNRLVNYFKVICYHNTKNIITMCPVAVGENLPYVDLNYLKKEKNNDIQLQSRRDKFYQKYGNVKPKK